MRSTPSSHRSLIAALLLALAAVGAPSAFAKDTKDIVIDRVSVAPAAAAATDAMAVSVLLESPDGALTPKPTNSLFRTGDRFRVKLLASRDAKVSLYNTNPKGETNPTPVWQGELKFGLETITPRLVLTGNSGVDQLHVVLEPKQEPNAGLIAWLTQWLRALKDGSSKDIQLDVQNTASTTYLVNNAGQGLVSTVSIVHTR